MTGNINQQALIKGDLTSEASVIEVKEVISFEKPLPVYNPPATNAAQPRL